jgi:hypothetical protein
MFCFLFWIAVWVVRMGYPIAMEMGKQNQSRYINIKQAKKYLFCARVCVPFFSFSFSFLFFTLLLFPSPRSVQKEKKQCIKNLRGAGGIIVLQKSPLVSFL